jgi:hypothetical protein
MMITLGASAAWAFSDAPTNKATTAKIASVL